MSAHPHPPHGREPQPPSWFERNAGAIVRGLIATCVALIVGDLVFHFVGHKHVHFDIEAWPGFYAAAGFVSYVGLVLTAKQLRKLVMRPVDYYGEAPPEPVPPDPHPQPQQDAAVEHGREAATEPQAEARREPEAEAVAESEWESESEADSEAEAEAESEAESDRDEEKGR